MVVWGSDEPTMACTSVEHPRAESRDVLADAKAWGFGHHVPEPRPGPARSSSAR